MRDASFVVFTDSAGTVALNTRSLGLGLVVDGTEEPAPDPKTTYVDVPGADGSVDLSRALTGDVLYSRRAVKLLLKGVFSSETSAMTAYDSIVSAVHGMEMSVSTPSTRSRTGAYRGNCSITDHSYSGLSLEVTVEVDADPFIYVQGGSASLANGGSPATTSGQRVYLTDAACTRLSASYTENSRDSYPATSVLLCSSWANMFDASSVPCRLITASASAPDTWLKSSVMRRSGQKIRIGSCAVGWKERVTLLATESTTGWSYNPCFPLVGGKVYVTAWITGTVKAIASSVPAGESIDIRLIGYDGYGGVASDGAPASSTSSTELITVTAGQVLTNYPITLEWTGNLNCIALEVGWIASDCISVAFSITDSAPTKWSSASVSSQTIKLPDTMQRCATASDTVSVDATGSVLTKRTEQASDPYVCVEGTETALSGPTVNWPDDGRRAAIMLQGPYGPMLGLTTTAEKYPRASVSVDNAAMRATPTLACTAPTVVATGGKTVISPAGESIVMPLTLARGTNSIGYGILGDSDASLTWPQGVL